MRTARFTTRVAALAIAATLGLAACSTPGSTDSSSQSGPESGSSAESGSDSGPEVDRNPTGELPKISGAFGEVPVMTPVEAEAPKVITVETLEKGDGAVVGVDDVVTVNYAGFLWDGTPFDSSFGRGAPSTFSLNSVIQAWKYGLADTKVGDRVLLIAPPEWGYGDQANGDIPAGSTLVFVVDIIEVFGSDTSALESAELTDTPLPAGLIVEGELGEAPTVSFEDGVASPESEQTVVIAEGDGSVITADDTVVYHYLGTY